jgi:hypothetical protein
MLSYATAMASFSWQYVFRPRQAQWWVGIAFSMVGVLLALALPRLLMPEWQGIDTPARVVRVESNGEGLVRPVFADDEREYTRGLWSSRTAFAAGQAVTIVRSQDRADWYVKADAEQGFAALVVRVLGGVFLLVGTAVLAMTVVEAPDYLVHTVGGALGALSFGVPALFALPGLYWAHQVRPNVLFGADDAFGTEQWLIGGLFSGLGLLTTVATVWLARYQLRNRRLGWRWSYDSDEDER